MFEKLFKDNTRNYVYFSGSKYRVYGTFVKDEKTCFLLWSGVDWMHVLVDRCVPAR
jgi:hypothetical protein